MNKKFKQFWDIKNSADNNESADILIYGDISNYDFWEDDITPKKFNEDLKDLGEVNTINLRINSNGGSVFAAYAIMNTLKHYKAKVITYIDGIAASAASIIAMAGDKIIMPLGSIIMIHNPLNSLFGSYYASDLRKMADVLDTIRSTMLDIYKNRTSLEESKLIELLDAETYLTPKEALELGFADEILDMTVEAHLGADKSSVFFNGQKFGVSNLKLDKIEAKIGKITEANTQINIPKPINKSETKEETIVDLSELKSKYPNIYEEAVNEGIKAERQRIKAIEDIMIPGIDKLANKAKFESGITASDLAIEVLKDQKEKGIGYLNNEIDDAKHLETVPTHVSDETNKEEELLKSATDAVKNMRK